MTEAFLKNKKGGSVHPPRRTFYEAEVFKKVTQCRNRENGQGGESSKVDPHVFVNFILTEMTGRSMIGLIIK